MRGRATINVTLAPCNFEFCDYTPSYTSSDSIKSCDAEGKANACYNLYCKVWGAHLSMIKIKSTLIVKSRKKYDYYEI